MKKITWQIPSLIIVIILVVVLIGGESYAYYRISRQSDVDNKITADTLDLVLDETSATGIRLESEVPKSFQQATAQTVIPYSFKLRNDSGIDTDYEIKLEDYYIGDDASLTADDKLEDSFIRYILLKEDEQLVATNSKLLNTATNRVIETGTINGKTNTTPTIISYKLYVWIDSKAGENNTQDSVMNKIFNARLKISASQHSTNS